MFYLFQCDFRFWYIYMIYVRLSGDIPDRTGVFNMVITHWLDIAPTYRTLLNKRLGELTYQTDWVNHSRITWSEWGWIPLNTNMYHGILEKYRSRNIFHIMRVYLNIPHLLKDGSCHKSFYIFYGGFQGNFRTVACFSPLSLPMSIWNCYFVFSTTHNLICICTIILYICINTLFFRFLYMDNLVKLLPLSLSCLGTQQSMDPAAPRDRSLGSWSHSEARNDQPGV